MSPSRRSARPLGSAGFTLVEVLVAFVIAAIGLQLAFALFATHTRLLDSGLRQRRAVTLADSLLARVGTEIAVQPGTTRGVFDPQYRWCLRVVPFPRGDADTHPAVAPYDVAVEVAWPGWLADRSIRLRTLKLAPPPPHP